MGALVVRGGGDLVIRELTGRNAPGVGITVQLPGTATGTVTVTLDGVHALDNEEHGVLINERPATPPAPSPRRPTGRRRDWTCGW